MLESIRIVLVATSHPGNIGAAARAMKTMGLQHLYLVQPKHYPHEDATALASGADELLAQAVVVESLEQAIADCHLVIGTSARQRSLPWPVLSPRQCADKIREESKQSQVAIVFGTERVGLQNEQLQLCHYHLAIPANPDYSSLNLAAAVQVICYELRVALLEAEAALAAEELATSQEMADFYNHLEQVLLATEFLDPANPRQLMARLKRLFNRCRPEKIEMNILRGILTAVGKKLGI